MNRVLRRANARALTAGAAASLLHAGLCAVTAGALAAQAAQPFLPAAADAHASHSTQFAALDLNRDGSVDLLSPSVFTGAVLATLDERGGALAKETIALSFQGHVRTSAPLRPAALAAGDLDGDGLTDLVFTLADGTLFAQRNLGSTRIDQPQLDLAQQVDYLGALLAPSSPATAVTFAKLEVLDLNGDGVADILLGCGLHDAFAQVAGGGMVCCYLGDGAGGFQPVRHHTVGSVSDVEWADIDGDGWNDHLVVLQESGVAGAFHQQLLHLRLHSGAIVASKPPLLLGPGRPVALEVGDVDLDGMPDYVVAMLHAGGVNLDASVVCFAGDGAGQPSVGTYQTLPLPLTSAVGSYIPSIQLEDFDGDGSLDVAVLRGHLSTYATPGSTALTDEAEVHVCMGPAPFQAVPHTLPLESRCFFGHCNQYDVSVQPLRTAPDHLKVLDLSADGHPDLMMCALWPTASPTTPHRLTLYNNTPPRHGDPALVKVGDPSGGDPLLAARIGFDGGAPRIGNPSFSCTIQNLRPGCVCGLMWGPYAQANLVEIYGFQLHIGPLVFGDPMITAGEGTVGWAKQAFPLPNEPALVGDTGYFQFHYYDPSVGAMGATQATGLWIGS